MFFQRRGQINVKHGFNFLAGDLQDKRRFDGHAGEGKGIVFSIHCVIFNAVREAPLFDNRRFPGIHFVINVEELRGHRGGRNPAAPEADKVITAHDIEHRSAVIQRAAFRRILIGGCRMTSVHHEEQVFTVLFGENVIRGIVHRQMIGRHHDDGVIVITGFFNFIDKGRNQFLAAGHRAQRLVSLTVHFIFIAGTAARNKAVRMVGIDGQREQRERFSLFAQRHEFFVYLIQQGIVIPAPVIFI